MTEENDDRTAARRAGEPENWDRKVITEIMATPQGRDWMARKLDAWGPHHPTYAHDGDALGMAWRDGRASAGRELESELLAYCPDRYVQMIRQQRAKIESERKRQEREEGRRGDPAAPTGLTSIDEMADAQQREEEAERLKNASKTTQK